MPKRESVSRAVTPFPLAMTVADAIWKDQATGKHFILGTFSELFSSRFPAIHPNLGVFVEITGGRGKMPITLKIVDAEESRPDVRKVDGEANFGDARAVMQIPYNLSAIQFPTEGEYRIQFFANNEFLMERRIVVMQAPQRPPIGT